MEIYEGQSVVIEAGKFAGQPGVIYSIKSAKTVDVLLALTEEIVTVRVSSLDLY